MDDLIKMCCQRQEIKKERQKKERNTNEERKKESRTSTSSFTTCTGPFGESLTHTHLTPPPSLHQTCSEGPERLNGVGGH